MIWHLQQPTAPALPTPDVTPAPTQSPVTLVPDIVIDQPDIILPGQSYWVPIATICAAVLGACVLWLNEIRKSRREDARKLLELDREDRRHWHKEIRQIYVDTTHRLKQLEELHLKPTHISVEEMERGESTYSYSLANMESNRKQNPEVVRIEKEISNIYADAEILADTTVLGAMADIGLLLFLISSQTHDGIYYPMNTKQLGIVKKNLRDATRSSIWGEAGKAGS